jgi:hypothetical protein
VDSTLELGTLRVKSGIGDISRTRREFSSRFWQSICTFQDLSRAYIKIQRLKISWAYCSSGSILGFLSTLDPNLKSVLANDRWLRRYTIFKVEVRLFRSLWYKSIVPFRRFVSQ